MMTRTRTPQRFTRASLMAGLGLAVLVVTAPAPAARPIGDRIFLFVLLADREGERAVKVLLEERSAC